MAERGRVPAEFVGMARLLLARIRARDDEIADVATRIGAMLRKRLRTSPKLRPDLINEIIRTWARESPSEFRLTLEWAAEPSKRPTRLRIGEVRICFEQNKMVNGPDEPGIALAVLWCSTFKGGLRGGLAPPILLISQRALARRYQRGRDRSDEAVVRDIGALMNCRDDDVAYVPSGCWLGEWVECSTGDGTTMRVVSYRSFMDKDELVSDTFLRRAGAPEPVRQVTVR